jgi:hypothetical protein
MVYVSNLLSQGVHMEKKVSCSALQLKILTRFPMGESLLLKFSFAVSEMSLAVGKSTLKMLSREPGIL